MPIVSIIIPCHNAAPWLAACAVLLIAFPIAAPLLPAAVATGLTHAPAPHFHWTWLLPLAVAIFVWWLEQRGHRLSAILTIVTGAAIGLLVMKNSAAPNVDRIASARTLRQQLSTQQDAVCVDWVPRKMEYSLDYYFVPPLPKCEQRPRPVWLHQLEGQLPVLGPPKSAQ